MNFSSSLQICTQSRNRRIEVKKNIKNLAALYSLRIVSGKATLFVQSEINEHAALGYVMQAICYMGELERMTQYKDKNRNRSRSELCSFTYPALMAADILYTMRNMFPWVMTKNSISNSRAISPSASTTVTGILSSFRKV